MMLAKYDEDYYLTQFQILRTSESNLTPREAYRNFTYNGMISLSIQSPSGSGPYSTMLLRMLPYYYAYSNDNESYCNYNVSVYCPVRIAIHK